MVGNLITKAREEKSMTKTELAKIVGIDLGHLTHIEKGERTPSRKTLKKICLALNIPYQKLLLAYETPLEESEETYEKINYFSYNKILAIESINDLIDCPVGFEMASFAFKISDNSMSPILKVNDLAFICGDNILNENDIGLFKVNNNFLVRYFSHSNNNIVLKAENSKYSDILLSNNDEFYIIGKVLH